MAELLIGIAGGIVVPIVLWLLSERRKAKAIQPAQAGTGFLAIVHGLSPLELKLLKRIAQASAECSELEEKFPTNHLMNTAESNDAKGKAWLQLTEPELMKAVGTDSPGTFRIIALTLKSHEFIEYSTPDEVWLPETIWITELGIAALEAAGV